MHTWLLVLVVKNGPFLLDYSIAKHKKRKKNLKHNECFMENLRKTGVIWQNSCISTALLLISLFLENIKLCCCIYPLMYIYFKVSFSRFYSGESIAILSITYIDGDIKKIFKDGMEMLQILIVIRGSHFSCQDSVLPIWRWVGKV